MNIKTLLMRKNKVKLFFGLLMMVSTELIISLDPMAFEPKRLYIYFFAMIPGLLIVVLWLFSSNKKVNKIITAICMIVYIAGLFRGCVGLGWETSGPFKDVKYYKEILEESNYPNSPKVRHFPAEIPKSAYNIKMVYYRGFLQGDQSLKLCMTLNDSDFYSTLKRFGVEKETLFKEKKDITIDEAIDGKAQSEIINYWQYITFRTGDYSKYPDDFYFIDGVAFSLARKEVIYWY